MLRPQHNLQVNLLAYVIWGCGGGGGGSLDDVSYTFFTTGQLILIGQKVLSVLVNPTR